MGICPGELLPPYSRDLATEDIERFWRLLSNRDDVENFMLSTGVNGVNRALNRGDTEIEVVGAWGEACVRDSIQVALKLGMKRTYTPDNMVFFDNPIEKIIIPEIQNYSGLRVFKLPAGLRRIFYRFEEGVHIFESERVTWDEWTEIRKLK